MKARWRAAAICVAGLLAASGSANAQTSAPTAARLATLQARHATGIEGTVRVTPQGTGSMVNVVFSRPPARANESLMLMSGADCSDVMPHAATMVPLKPISGNSSRTLVSIPFSAFRSGHFLVDVRDATSHVQMVQACAHL